MTGNTRWRVIQDADVWKIPENKKMAGIKDGGK